MADRRHLVVDVDGQVYGCVAFAESYQRFPTPMLQERLTNLRIGDVRAPDLAERLAAYREAARATDILVSKEEKHSSYGRCADCRYLESCAVCPVSIGHEPGNDDPGRVPDFRAPSPEPRSGPAHAFLDSRPWRTSHAAG